MKLKDQFSLRSALVFLIAVPVAAIFIAGLWGATGGAAIGSTVLRDPQIQNRFTALMKEKAVKSQGSRAETREPYESLSQQETQEIKSMVKEAMRRISWFALTLFVSATVFGVVGFFGGFFARAWLLAGVVPALSFLLNNPLCYQMPREELSVPQKIIVVALAQFRVCYLLAYCGARLGLKRL